MAAIVEAVALLARQKGIDPARTNTQAFYTRLD
jgi:hypothetical protein